VSSVAVTALSPLRSTVERAPNTFVKRLASHLQAQGRDDGERDDANQPLVVNHDR
jgi:hypothetical protein